MHITGAVRQSLKLSRGVVYLLYSLWWEWVVIGTYNFTYGILR